MTDKKPQAWTPEPWCAIEGEIKYGPSSGDVTHGWRISPKNHECDIPVLGIIYEVQANAKRVIACVNSLARVPDPAEFMEECRNLEDAVAVFLSTPCEVSRLTLIWALAHFRKAGGA